MYSQMAGGDLTTQIGLAPGSDFLALGKGSAILVVGCDLEEEAPVWWLRIKQAAGRGATVITLNPRQTKLDAAAAHRLRYPFGNAAASVLALVNALSAKRAELPESVQELARSPELKSAAGAFAEAQDADHRVWQRRHGPGRNAEPGAGLRQPADRHRACGPSEQRVAGRLAAGE